MMDGMQISSRASFDRSPADTFALLTDQAFLEAVAVAGHALSYDVSVSGDTTVSTQELPAPDMAANFVGKTITVVQEVAWGPADASGGRTGQVTMTVPKQPVVMKGTVTLAGTDAASTVDLAGDLKVSIPLLGKKLEQASEPAVLSGFRKQEEVAQSWNR